MTAIYDFISIALFFIIYKLYGIFAATAAINVLLIGGVLFHRIRYKKFDNTQLIICLGVLLLSIPTFLLHNPIYIKWKPTLISWLLSGIMLASNFVGNKKSIFQLGLEKQAVIIPEIFYKRVNYAWAVYFALIGAVNIYVAYHFSTDTWVNFKLFGTMGCSILMTILTVLYLAPHSKQT